MRIGIGYDIHRLVVGRRLVLGGVTIPFEKGLLGHSDADVLVHSICDALLGAAGLGDIGSHFPDNDPQYKDVSSLLLLAQTRELFQSHGFRFGNLDATVFAEAPKLAPFQNAMRQQLSKVLEVDAGLINIKATTTEGLGVIGAGEAIAAMSIALLEWDFRAEVYI